MMKAIAQERANSVTSVSILVARPRDRSLPLTHRSTTPKVRTTWSPARMTRTARLRA
jgi:hypothetical protein